MNSTSSVSVCPSSTIVAPFWPTRLKQFEIVLPIVSEPVAITAMFRRSSPMRSALVVVLSSAAFRSFDAFWRAPLQRDRVVQLDATSLSPSVTSACVSTVDVARAVARLPVRLAKWQRPEKLGAGSSASGRRSRSSRQIVTPSLTTPAYSCGREHWRFRILA